MKAAVITRRKSIVEGEKYAFQRGGNVYYLGKFRGNNDDSYGEYGFQFGDDNSIGGGNWSLSHLLRPTHTLMKIDGIEGIDFNNQEREKGVGCLIHNQDLADKLENIV